MKKTALILSVSVLSLTFNSCGKDFLETIPTRDISEAEVMSTFEGAMMAVNGIHRLMYANVSANNNTSRTELPSSISIGYGQGISSMWLAMDHMGDDFVYFVAPASWFVMYNWVTQTRQESSAWHNMWAWCYQIINNANGIINRINEFEASDNDRNYILGQALAYRAFGHFWAVQMWGGRYVRGETNDQLGVPLITRHIINPEPRATVAQVYAQINEDLTRAIELLTDNPSAINRRNKSHINANVANGLMARVALVQQRWEDAAHHARLARQGIPLATAEDLLAGFHSVNAPEWIWGMRVTDSPGTTNFALFISLNSLGSPSIVRTEPRLVNRQFFDWMASNDIRRDWWVTNPDDPRYAQLLTGGWAQVRRYSNQKFRVNGSFTPIGSGTQIDRAMMRGSEMLLIEAEAEARGAIVGEGSEVAARAALTTLMGVRVSGFTTTRTEAALIEEIMQNRRIELWGEGHRWLDLKRLGEGMWRTAEQGHLPGLTGNTMQGVEPDDLRWNIQLPQREIETSRDLIRQNPL